MRREKAQSSEIRLRLLDCGVRLIQKNGFHATGVKDLVDAAGIPKGSFYYYFPSKEAFVAEAVLHYIHPFLEKLETIAANKPGRAIDALNDYFHGLTLEFENNLSAGGCLLGNLLGEIGDTSEVALDALGSAVTAYTETLCQLLVRAQEEGDIRTDIDAFELAGLLFDAWQGAILRMRVNRSVQPLRQFLDSTLSGLFLSR